MDPRQLFLELFHYLLPPFDLFAKSPDVVFALLDPIGEGQPLGNEVTRLCLVRQPKELELVGLSFKRLPKQLELVIAAFELGLSSRLRGRLRATLVASTGHGGMVSGVVQRAW
jgi:hypothetical protein